MQRWFLRSIVHIASSDSTKVTLPRLIVHNVEVYQYHPTCSIDIYEIYSLSF